MSLSGLPLLQRELIEQSTRRRTYFFTVYLYLPAMCCGLITAEKERNTLQLLFLTRLSPWSIVIEKLLSRVTPFLFMLVSVLPIMMICFAVGGLKQEYVWSAIYTLLLAAVQVACLAVFCSSFCRTTTAAFVMTYLLGAAVALIPLGIGYVGYLITGDAPFVQIGNVRYAWFAALMPPILIDYAERHTFLQVVACSIPMVLSCFGFLYLAKSVLIPRAEATATNLPKRMLRWVDDRLATAQARSDPKRIYPQQRAQSAQTQRRLTILRRPGQRTTTG